MRENGQGGGMGVMMAMLTGAVVGAGVALLFAPASGAETRTWLADRKRSLKDKTTKALAQGMDAVHRVSDQMGKDGEGQTRTAYVKPPTTSMRG